MKFRGNSFLSQSIKCKQHKTRKRATQLLQQLLCYVCHAVADSKHDDTHLFQTHYFDTCLVCSVNLSAYPHIDTLQNSLYAGAKQ